MEFLIIFFGIFIFLLFFFRENFFQKSESEKIPYKKKKFLLNIPERVFFEELQKILPEKYIVFPQISIDNIVSVDTRGKDFWQYQNKINRKTIDFVIFEKQYLTPVIAIEYDGKTHERKDRKERDLFVRNVLDTSGIRLLRVKHEKNIDFSFLMKEIEQYF